jgi:5-hydroxyisourate hydrolase-like protein (transthyretin family)
MRIGCAAFLALSLASPSAAQIVQIGSNDRHYCANVEHIKANLHMPSSVQLMGHVEDETGAPFKNSRIELRRYVSEVRQVRFANATTDDNGDFHFGDVSKGDYRLLASPTRAFKQPDETWCSTGRQCFLHIILKGNPTDLPASQCPIR